jgi:predicted esterase
MVTKELGATGPLVFSGFSQGVAMTFRAACASTRPVAGVVALGGDVPPELDRTALARVRNALMGRGERDDWYTAEKRAVDVARLGDARVNLEAPVLNAAHEWTADFSRVAGAFLDRFA